MPLKSIFAAILIMFYFNSIYGQTSSYSFPNIQLKPSGLNPNLEFHEITAHRGNRVKLRENSLSSLLNSMDIGATSVEFDVHLTKDGIPVIYHDYYLNPADFKNLAEKTLIKNLSLAEIKQIHFSDNLKTLESDTSLPTLKEFLLAVKTRENKKEVTIPLHLEIKSEINHLHESAPIELLAKKIALDISETNLTSPIIVRAFNWQVLNHFMEFQPNIPRVLLVDKTEFDSIPVEATIQRYKPLGISPHHADLTAENIKPWLQFGIKVNPWTVNSIERAKALIQMGVTGLTTDDPELFLSNFSNNIHSHHCVKSYLPQRKSTP